MKSAFEEALVSAIALFLFVSVIAGSLQHIGLL